MPFSSFPSRSVSLTPHICLHIWLFRLTAVYKSNCLFPLHILEGSPIGGKKERNLRGVSHHVATFSFSAPQKGKGREGKGKDGCKHSWLLKGEIYS